MSPALGAAVVLGAWTLLILLMTGGIWFLRRNHLVHTSVTLVAGLAAIFLVIYLHELLILGILAALVAFILDGPVTRLTTRMPRSAAICVVYLLLVGGLVALGVVLVPALVRDAQELVTHIPQQVDRFRSLADRANAWHNSLPDQLRGTVDVGIEQLKGFLVGLTLQVRQGLLGTLGWAVKSILVLVMSIYLLTDKRTLLAHFVRFFPADVHTEVDATIKEVAEVLRSYLRGQVTVILFIAVTVTVLLVAMRIPYAFFIGTMAGVLEVIPYFGALAGAIPAVTLGFMHSPATGVILIIAFVVLNQIEGHLVIPLVMGKHLEMRPLAILVTLIAGELLAGVVGMIIAVPVVSLLRVIVPHVYRHYQAFKLRERARVLTHPAEAAAPPGGSVEDTPAYG